MGQGVHGSRECTTLVRDMHLCDAQLPASVTIRHPGPAWVGPAEPRTQRV